jgi:hypothetical protein
MMIDSNTDRDAHRYTQAYAYRKIFQGRAQHHAGDQAKDNTDSNNAG